MFQWLSTKLIINFCSLMVNIPSRLLFAALFTSSALDCFRGGSSCFGRFGTAKTVGTAFHISLLWVTAFINWLSLKWSAHSLQLAERYSTDWERFESSRPDVWTHIWQLQSANIYTHIINYWPSVSLQFRIQLPNSYMKHIYFSVK